MAEFDLDSYLNSKLGAPNPGKINDILKAKDAKIVDLQRFRESLAQNTDQALTQQAVDDGRTWGEFGKDVALSGIQGLDSLAKLPAMAVDKATTGNWFGPETQRISEMSDEREKLKSAFAQANTQQKAQAAKEAGEAAKAYVGEGALGTAAQVAAEFGSAFWEAAKDPASIPEFLAQQAAQLGVMGKVGRGAEIVANSAAKIAPKLAATKAGQAALEKSATAGAVTFGAGLQGVDTGSDTMQRIMKLPDEVWAQNPEYTDLLQTMRAEDAKQFIASRLAGEAAMKAAGASLLSAAIIPGGSGIEKALVGKQRGGYSGVPKVFAGEAGQEGIEEGTGAFFGNTSVREIDSKQDAFEGVGAAAGQGAFMGGILGGGISAASTASSNAAVSASERQLKRAESAAETKALNEAIASGDVTPYIDPKNPAYAPEKAVAVLFGNAQKADATPESKQANLEQASSIVSDLEAQRTKAQQRYDSVSPETVASYTAQLQEAQANGEQAKVEALEAELAALAQEVEKAPALQRAIEKIDAQLTTARNLLRNFAQEIQPKDLDVQAEAKKIDGVDPVASQAAASSIINLSMAIPERLDSAVATQLADSPQNGLTAPQRAYLRAFSVARAAENLLKDMGKVSQEIYFGGNGNLGIKDYRLNVGAALAAGNQGAADRQLGMLDRFIEDHTTKAEVSAQALAQFQTTGQPVQVRSNGQRGWYIHTGAPLTESELRKEGGVLVNEKSTKLVEGFKTEADALTSAATELQAAYQLKFAQPASNGASDVQNVSQAPEGVEGASQQLPVEAQAQAGTADSGAGTQGAADAVQSDATAGAPAVTEEAPASAVNTASTQEDQGQLQSTEQTTRTSEEVVPVPEAVAEAVEPQGLTALQQKSPEGTAHGDKKLGDFFTQSAGKDTDGSKRPLVAVKNFMSAVAAGTVKIGQYIKDQNLSEGSKPLVWAKFVEKAAQWAPIITRNLKTGGNEKFNYTDPMRYLIQSMTVNGKTAADVEENVKTAIAAAVFGYTADQAGRPELNDDKAINGILNRSKDSPVSDDAREKLESVGVYQSQVIDSLGSAVMDALGFRLNADAPQDMLAKMRVSLGGHALKLMEDQGLLVRSDMTNGEMNRLRNENLFEDGESGNQTNESASFSDTIKGHIFFKLARDKSGEPIGSAKEIADAIKGSQSLIQNLFGIESSLSFPSLTPPKGLQKESDTGMGLPGFIKKVFKLNQSRPWKANKDPLKVLSFFSEEEGMSMAGVEDSSEHTHRRNFNSKRAKNDGLIREFRNFMEFVGELATGEKGMDQEFFLSQEMWKQQRSGYKTNTVNPNTSKIVRWLVAPDAWSTDIDLNNEAQLQSFMLRASEGFGIKPEKADSQKAVDDLTAMMQTTAMQAAVKALQTVLFSENAELNEQQRTDIMTAVTAGKQKLHTLASLIAYARYQQAADQLAIDRKTNPNAEGSFTTNLMGEVDGVSNGSILNSIMYGAAATAEQLNMLLEKGGIYTFAPGTQEPRFKGYNLWRGTPGHQDIYESNAQDLHAYVSSMPVETRAVTGAIWATAGSPINDALEATKDGRDLLKGPINPLNYGGGFKSIIGKMAYNYVDAIYEKLEGFSRKGADQTTVNEFVRNVNVLLSANRVPQMPVGKPISYYLGYTLSKAQEAALRKAYSDTIGAAAKEVVGANFKPFLDRSKLVTQTVNLTYGLYEAVYNASREAMIKEMGIPMSKGEPIHDLTVAQEAELAERLKDILPAMHTAMSKDEGKVENGILLAKKSRKQNNSAPYKVVVGFGSKLKNDASQLTASGRSMVQTDPGVIAISGTTHALDSAVSHEAQEANHVLNNHDAVGAGINVLADSAKSLNQSTWTKTLNYSPLNEAHDALMRVVQGIVAMDQRGELTPEIKAAIKEKLKEISKKNRGSKVESIVDTTAFNIFSEALEANRIKFGAMAQWAVVDQYAMDGGSYEVTEADRKEAQDKLNALSPVRSEADRQALDAFASMMFGAGAVSAAPVAPAAAAPKATVTSLFGSIGTPAIASEPDLVTFFEGKPEASAAEVIKLLGAEGRMNAINRKILQLVSRVVSPDLKIKFVTSATSEGMVLEKPTTNARGWFVIKDNQEEIYVLSPEFVNSGLTAETLLHELVHAAVARVIDAPSKEAEALVAELEALRGKAQEFATANGLTQYAPALANVQEFVAWGMSNLGLQRDVLTKITMPSKTGSNRLVTGMQKFISALTGLLFKKPDANIDNGLAVLVSNVSGLFFEASQVNARTGNNLNLAQETVAPIDAYTTLDIHQALDNGTLEPSFKAHLANLLGGIVEKLHGPFGAFAASMRKTEAGNPLAVWLKAMETGQAPFASRIVASGFAGSAQEDFAMQQVEATVKAALNGNEALTKIAYKQLSDLYTEVKGKLKPSDFKSQEDYDFVFKLESDNGDRSDYLARFAALGLANQQFNSMLKMATERDTRRFGEGQTFTERLENIFEKIVAFFNEKVTRTFAGQNADEKLEALVGQLVDIEAKKRHLIKRKATQTNYLLPVEEGAKKASDAIRAKVGEIAGSDFVRNNSLAVVRAAGGLARTVANDRVELFLDGLQRLRDKEFNGRQGIVAGLITDLKGPLDHFALLLRETKRHEGERKSIITQHAKLSLQNFINSGKDLSMEAKASISSVFMRTGAHNLLGTMSLSEIEKLIGDPAELNKAIESVENQLTGKFKERYIEQANALGYYKATGKSRNPVLMLNAYLIARMAGTQFRKQINEQDAKQAEPIIASLVSLYALKYTSVQDLAQAKQVFRTENNRKDGNGNGVEFVLKLHKQMEAESLERLFKGNPALMIHGYTPEILNPHTAIKIADEAEGANLEAQGYSKGAKVTQDLADPDKSTKRIYVLKDGGLAPYLTGVFSLTGLQAKGTKKQNGYVNVSTQAGLDNAVLQAEITNTKLQTLQGKNDPRRDLSQQVGNHLVPVFNEMGDIVNWRYMMAESTKDNLLERDNRFENILGAFAGSIYDKETTQQQNLKAVEVLLEQYNAEFATRSDSYIEVSERSTDPEMRAIWNLLPDATKKDIRKVWGRNAMMVRSDALDLMFGYRKLSAAEFLRNDPETLQGVQKILREWFNTYARSRGMTEEEADNYAKRLGLALTKGERAWQELVREAKDIIVVKTGVVMLGNIWSNISLLAMSGVPIKDMMQHHLVAMKGATAYQRDSERLAQLETVLEVNYSANDERKIRDEIVRLKDAIARNPVRELIEAGLMPTIVEDIAAEEDIYSYKSALARKTERFTDKLNPSIKAAGRLVYMSHDTKMYQSLSRITQLSDFVARYTLYQHLTTRSNNPLSQADAIQEASDAFVNYDIPMHRGIQFTDDMGFTPFTKYFLRIQRVLLKLARENPARVFMALGLNSYMELGPIVLDSSFVSNIGDNPLRSGAFQFPGALDDLATVNAAMALIK